MYVSCLSLLCVMLSCLFLAALLVLICIRTKGEVDTVKQCLRVSSISFTAWPFQGGASLLFMCYA